MVKNKKSIDLMKDELGGKIIKEIVALRLKMYSYLTDEDHAEKKANDIKKYVIKWEIKFQNYKECLEVDKTTLRSQQRFRSETHDVFTEKVNKFALSTNDDKRILTHDGVTTCPYGYGC